MSQQESACAPLERVAQHDAAVASDPPLSHLRRGAARHVDPFITNVEVSLSARGPQVFVLPATTVSMARYSVILSALPDECSCFLSSWGRPHLVLPTLRAQERDEHALYAHLLRHAPPRLVGTAREEDAELLVSGRKGATTLPSSLSWQTGCDPVCPAEACRSSPRLGTFVTHSPQFCLCLVLDDLLMMMMMMTLNEVRPTIVRSLALQA